VQVVSGIASLFEGEEKKKPGETEREMNPTDVHIVDNRVTDDWDTVKHRMDGNLSSLYSNITSHLFL
jgi:hypothetical protein